MGRGPSERQVGLWGPEKLGHLGDFDLDCWDWGRMRDEKTEQWKAAGYSGIWKA